MAGFMGLAKSTYEKIEAKTADYYIKPGDIGKIFTNRGAAGAVVFYLPDSVELEAGWNVTIFIVEAQNVTLSGVVGDDDDLVVQNDKAADSIAFSTAGEIIGNSMYVIWDGTGFLVQMHLAAEAFTSTVVTA